MDFVAVLDQVIALLRQRGRVTYRTLKIQFTLDDAQLAALKDELLYSQPQVVDDAGRGLVWTGDTGVTPALCPLASSHLRRLRCNRPDGAGIRHHPLACHPQAERRQLTVLFCDLVDSTALPVNSTTKTCARWCGPTKNLCEGHHPPRGSHRPVSRR